MEESSTTAHGERVASAPATASRRRSLDAHVGRRLADVERDLVLETLARCGGNRTWAADILGLAPAELRERLLDYNREVEERSRAAARREARMMADEHSGEGPRATYLPSVAFLA